MNFIIKPGNKIEGLEVDLVLDQCVPEDPSKGYVPAYNFSIMLHSTDTKIGHLHLRIGMTESIKKYAGNIGYGINEAYRGNNYAAKACQLTRNLLKKHNMNLVWITSNPKNLASIKTLQKIGAKFVETLKVPENHEIFQMGESHKSRFSWNIKI